MSVNEHNTSSLAQLLQSNSSCVKHVWQKAQQLQLLSQTLHRLLPPSLNNKVSVLNYQAGILKLGISNQSTAVMLRYQLSDLMSQLRQMPQWYDLVTIKPIVILTTVETLFTPQSPAEPLPLSAHVKSLLQSYITATDDDTWRESLLRFLQHHCDGKSLGES